jgi:enamine deaminase RidA (YjgF/YER057c/UK114 family)
MSVEARLEKAGLTLPPTPKPVGAYHPAIRAANLIYTSGQLPLAEGGLLAEGKVPTVVAVESAKLCARQAALNALAALQTQIESLDDIIRIVRVTVYVNSAQGFTGQAEVANWCPSRE